MSRKNKNSNKLLSTQYIECVVRCVSHTTDFNLPLLRKRAARVRSTVQNERKKCFEIFILKPVKKLKKFQPQTKFYALDTFCLPKIFLSVLVWKTSINVETRAYGMRNILYTMYIEQCTCIRKHSSQFCILW